MSVKVLLAGMNRSENQISRNLKNLGCEVVHISGDPGGYIPDDCDAAVVCKTNISHQKFYQVKDAYHSLNKPVFITDFGFSPIRERFMQFLDSRPKISKPVDVSVKYKHVDTALAKAFQEAGLKADIAAPEIIQMGEVKSPESPGVTPHVNKSKESSIKKRLTRSSWAVRQTRSIYDLIAAALVKDTPIEERVNEVQRLINGEEAIITRRAGHNLQFLALSGGGEPRLILNLDKIQAAAVMASVSEIEKFLAD